MVLLERFALALCFAAMVYFARQLWYAHSGASGQAVIPRLRRKSNFEFAPSIWLRTLGFHMQWPLFVVLLAVLGGLVFTLLRSAFPVHMPLAFAGAGAVVLMGVYGLHDYAKWRVLRLEKALVESLDVMRASLATGLSSRQALSAAAKSSRGRLKIELLEIIERLDMGCSAEQALARLTARYDSEAVRLFAQTIIAHYRSGGDFSRMLAAVNRLLHERIRQRMVINGQLSGNRYAALFAGILPYGLIPVFLWKEPTWFDTLLAHPNGLNFLVGAIILQVLGALWLRKVLKVVL